MVTTRTARRSDAASLASRRSKTGSKITEYNREDYKLIPTPGWPGYYIVGKILAYQLGEKLKGSWLYRRGVIVEYFEGYSTLLPIKTYGGRGCSHLKEEQNAHSAIYVGSRPPFTRQEPSLRVAIQACRLDIENSANPRINYNGKFNLSHTERVREVGQVSGGDLEILLNQYREVHGIAQESTAAPSPELLAPPDAEPLPRVEGLTRLVKDREDSGPQRKGRNNGPNSSRIQPLDLSAIHSLAETPQTPQKPKKINSATTPRTLPSKPAGPSRAPLLSSKKNPTPLPPILSENSNEPPLQDGSTEIHKTPHNDVESLPKATSPAVESSRPVPSTKSLPQPEETVKPAQAAPSTETFPERAAPPTGAVETPLVAGNHLTPAKAVGSTINTTSEEVIGPMDLSVSRAVNTVSGSQAVNLDIQALQQMMISMLEIHKETTRQMQETNIVVRDLAKKQEMRDTFDYTMPSFPMREMVASLHIPPPPAYTNLPQTMDAHLPQHPEKEASASPAAAKNKQRAVDGIPPPAPMPPQPALRYELDETYGGHHHHAAATHDPAYSYYPQNELDMEHSNYQPESSNSAATRPYTRNPPPSDWYRSIWVQDEGFKSTIQAWALVDTGAHANFISEQAIQQLDATVYPYRGHVTLGNGQEQAIHGSVGLHFGLNSQPKRWQDQFLVVAGLPYDVVFGRELNARLKFYLVNKEMLVLAPDRKGKLSKEAAREAERQRERQEEENDRQVQEQTEREYEERRARRAKEHH